MRISSSPCPVWFFAMCMCMCMCMSDVREKGGYLCYFEGVSLLF